MKETLREQVREFYSGLSPRLATLERLTQLAATPAAVQPVVRAMRWRPALAAALALSTLAAAYYTGYRSGRQTNVGDGLDLRGIASPARDAAPALYDGKPLRHTPRLVLAKLHADWCPRSPQVAPIFTELSERYANEPILFVTLDMTTEASRAQLRKLATSLDILDQIGERQGERVKLEPGLIRLIDRDAGKVVATLRERDERPQFEAAIAHALPVGASQPAVP